MPLVFFWLPLLSLACGASSDVISDFCLHVWEIHYSLEPI